MLSTATQTRLKRITVLELVGDKLVLHPAWQVADKPGRKPKKLRRSTK